MKVWDLQVRVLGAPWTSNLGSLEGLGTPSWVLRRAWVPQRARNATQKASASVETIGNCQNSLGVGALRLSPWLLIQSEHGHKATV